MFDRSVSFLKQRKYTRFLAQAAVIAAVYVVLTVVFAPFSFSEVQVRISEALTILPVFTAAAVPGLTVGCLLGNIVGGAPLPDVVFGTLATLIGAVGTRMLRSWKPAAAILPPIVANMVIIPFVLRYAYDLELPIPLMMVTVGLGEVISCGVLGLLLYKALYPRRKELFR